MAVLMIAAVSAVSVFAAGVNATNTDYFFMDAACTTPAPMGQDCVYAAVNSNGTVDLLLGPGTGGGTKGYIASMVLVNQGGREAFTPLSPFTGFGTAHYVSDNKSSDGIAEVELS
jgi:hypothetical protein